MAETNFDEFKRKDCVFVANWLKTKGLHKLCSVQQRSISIFDYVNIFKVAQNSNISVRSLGSNAPFSAGNHAITRGFVR